MIISDIGHSIVRRFQEFLDADKDDRYLPGLDLSATYDISLRSDGGMLFGLLKNQTPSKV